MGKIGSRMFQTLAERSIGNKQRLSSILRASLIKLKQNPRELEKIGNQIRLLLQLLRDWMNGNYRDISRSSILTLVGGLIYFIVPTDILPDIIPITGFLDDISVITFVYTKIAQDIEKYAQWKETRLDIQDYNDSEQN